MSEQPDNIKRFGPAEERRAAKAAAEAPVEPPKPKPQRPQLELVPFERKDPNVLMARLERRLSLADDQLSDAQQVMAAQTKYILELEAYCGIEQPDPAAAVTELPPPDAPQAS